MSCKSPRAMLRDSFLSAAAILAVAAPASAQVAKLTQQELLAAAGVDAASTISLSMLPAGQPEAFQVAVLIRGRKVLIDLHRHSMRSGDFKLLVDDGAQIRQVPAPREGTYRGGISGSVDSVVAASLWNGQLYATIDDGRETWVVQPTSRLDAQRDLREHLVFNAKDSKQHQHVCGTTGAPLAVAPIRGGSVGPAAIRIAEIAIEADFPFYQRNGSSVSNTQNDVTTVMNAVAAIYKRDVEIDYKITTILVRTSSDPYTTNSSGTLLRQFGSWWASNQRSVRRDVAHLFTGRNLSGSVIGVAYLGVICTGSAYGLSESRFTSNFSARVGLTAHELGHNWASPHCASSSSDCRIMCAGLGGCARDLSRFGQASKSAILWHKNSRTCLDAAGPPIVSSISPASTSSFGGELITLKGSNLGNVTSVLAGSQVVNILVKPDPQTVQFRAPRPMALGAVNVIARTSTQNSVPQRLTYVPESPPKLVVPGFGISGSPLAFAVASEPASIAVIIVSPNNQTFPFLGSNILRDFTFMTAVSLDGIGVSQISVPTPRSLFNSRIYNQTAVFNGTRFVGGSNITTTFFL